MPAEAPRAPTVPRTVEVRRAPRPPRPEARPASPPPSREVIDKITKPAINKDVDPRSGLEAIAKLGQNTDSSAENLLKKAYKVTPDNKNEKSGGQVKLDVEGMEEELLQSENVMDRAQGLDFRVMRMANEIRIMGAQRASAGENLPYKQKMTEEIAKMQKAQQELLQHRAGMKLASGEVIPNQLVGVAELARAMGAPDTIATTDPVTFIDRTFREGATDKKSRLANLDKIHKFIDTAVPDEDRAMMKTMFDVGSDVIGNAADEQRKHEFKMKMLKIGGTPALLMLIMALLGAKASGVTGGGGGGQGGH